MDVLSYTRCFIPFKYNIKVFDKEIEILENYTGYNTINDYRLYININLFTKEEFNKIKEAIKLSKNFICLKTTDVSELNKKVKFDGIINVKNADVYIKLMSIHIETDGLIEFAFDIENIIYKENHSSNIAIKFNKPDSDQQFITIPRYTFELEV